MPTPRPNEKRSDFISRCVPEVMDEGRTQDEALGRCYGIWRNSKKENMMTDVEIQEEKEIKAGPTSDGKAIIATYIPWSATSFADVDEYMAAQEVSERMSELTRQFSQLTDNIMSNSEIKDKGAAMRKLVDELDSKLQDASELSNKSLWNTVKEILSNKATKTEGGKQYSASAFAYVPDSTKPSTWKLRMEETPGKVTVAQLGRAAAAFSSGGFRGRKVQIPAADVAKVKRKLRSAYRKLGVKNEDIPESIKSMEGLFLWKEKDHYRWFAVYSNNFRDDDNPPEILSSKAHREFVKAVDEGQIPYPQLWHWHIPGSQWGVADWLAFSEDTGMSLASGYVLEGHEKEAEAIMALKEPLAVSHGMTTVEYNKEDPTIIDRYVSLEISDLPVKAAANKLTGFTLMKEETAMGIPEEKKVHLRKVGLDDEEIAGIELDLEGKAAKAAEQGLESKEAESEKKEPVAEEPAEEPGEPKVEEEAEKETPEYATKEEVAEAIVAAVQPMHDALKQLLKTDEEKVAAKAADTPSDSISAMVLKNLSVVGKDEAQTTKKKDPDLSKKPKESREGQGPTGVPWIDSLFEKEE